MQEIYSREEVKTLLRIVLQEGWSHNSWMSAVRATDSWDDRIRRHTINDKYYRKMKPELAKAHRVLASLAAKHAKTAQPDDQATVHHFPNDYHAMKKKYQSSGLDV